MVKFGCVAGKPRCNQSALYVAVERERTGGIVGGYESLAPANFTE